ncbi:MAG: hypothetical protein ABI837_10570 [Acidobacteriota bacterium]
MGAGAAIAAVDNFAFDGEVSPILVVLLLVAATAAVGALWGSRAWIAAAAAWVWLPAAHVIKRIFHLPDTLHPNTNASLVMLASFTLAVTALGFGCGVLLHRRPADGGEHMHNGR